jgi:hypothetical protein
LNAAASEERVVEKIASHLRTTASTHAATKKNPIHQEAFETEVRIEGLEEIRSCRKYCVDFIGLDWAFNLHRILNAELFGNSEY